VTLLLLSLALATPGQPDPIQVFGPRADNPDAEAAPTAPATMGQLQVEALLPTEIVVDGVKIAQLWLPGSATFSIPVGDHLLRVYTQGKPNDLRIHVDGERGLKVLVGRTGVSTEQAAAPDLDATVAVEFRVMGTRAATLRLDDGKHKVQPGQPLALELDAGSHPLSVRSEDGTVIWASGVLAISGAAPVVVHVTEGRMPEVSGGGAFSTGG
jgi:hypothetical protein